MKTTKYLSIPLSVMFGVLFGTSQALAALTSLLNSDLASLTVLVLGASMETYDPTNTTGRDVSVWSRGGANATTGFNYSLGIAVSYSQVTGRLVYNTETTITGTPNAMFAQAQLTTEIKHFGTLGSDTLLADDSEPGNLGLLLIGLGFAGLGYNLRRPD